MSKPLKSEGDFTMMRLKHIPTQGLSKWVETSTFLAKPTLLKKMDLFEICSLL
jgi:hypothetical protein